MKLFHAILPAMAAAILLGGCGKQNAAHPAKPVHIGVFVPGIMADSPTYANLARGVQEAADEFNRAIANDAQKVRVTVTEAGTNQSEWATKLTALTAAGTYDVIVSSNESIPELAAPLTAQFPAQKYILMHGMLEGNQNIYCVNYNQSEQTYLTGYLAGLVSRSHKVGLIAAQEYPVMNNVLYPYFARGAADAAAGTSCEFRVVGNWYDASKGAELADALHEQGVDVILPICGGASQGVISSAVEHGMYLAYIDENSFVRAPGTVISSCATRQAEAAKEAVLDYLRGRTAWGTTRTVGLQEGYIEFIQDDPLYIQTVPEGIRATMADLVTALQDGSRTVPQL